MRTGQMAQTCIALDQSSGFLNLYAVQKVFLSNGIRATRRQWPGCVEKLQSSEETCKSLLLFGR